MATAVTLRQRKTPEPTLPKYLIAIEHPDTFDPREEGPEAVRDIDALNQEMEAAGVRFFAGGLEPPRQAKTIQREPGGNIAISDGPFLAAKEHVGGFWILDCADMNEAVQWGKKASAACRTPVEIRAFLRIPSR